MGSFQFSHTRKNCLIQFAYLCKNCWYASINFQHCRHFPFSRSQRNIFHSFEIYCATSVKIAQDFSRKLPQTNIEWLGQYQTTFSIDDHSSILQCKLSTTFQRWAVKCEIKYKILFMQFINTKKIGHINDQFEGTRNSWTFFNSEFMQRVG